MRGWIFLWLLAVAAGAQTSDPHAEAGVNSLLPQPIGTPPSSLSKVKGLEKVAVLHEGRIKPMETYARHMLLQFSGRTTYDKTPALSVIARILFTPEMVGDYRIFLINNPEVVEALGIAPEKRRRYSYRQLEKSLPKLQELAEKADRVEDGKRNLVEKEILRAYANLVQFVNLTRTFAFALPNPLFTAVLPETKRSLELPISRSVFSFWELMARAGKIAAVLESIGSRTQTQRSPEEREIIGLSQAMYLNSQSMHPSPFKVLPAGTLGWISPSEAVALPDQLQSFHDEMDAWAEALVAYREGREPDFRKSMAVYAEAIDNRAFEPLAKTHFPLEIAYQKTAPYTLALSLYWIALLACFGFFLLRRTWLYQASLYVFLGGYALHLAGIVSRIIIMRRPPVTSLYETFPFVAAVAIFAALFLERVNRKRRPAGAGIGLLCAALLGVILLSIAGRYAADGDTMRMLVAVLNSNFWLSTHVITVTIGYSACLLAGMIGHVWMIRALLPGGTDKTERLKEISKMVYGTICFGLLFSFIGTVLGGIWADQSWGRFWGWDPKENGALLIVIWCITLLHAKQWGYIQNMGMALGSISGAIVVALAWFGVNLLNVGLHSYGFTDGASTKLFAYIGAELLFMVVTGVWLRWGPIPASTAT